MKDKSIEFRVFTVISVFMIVMFLYGVVFRIIAEDYALAVIDLIGALVSGCVLFFGFRKGFKSFLVLPLVLMTVIFNVIFWFRHGGVEGSGPLLMASLILAVVLSPERWRRLVTIGLFVTTLILVVLDKYLLEWNAWGVNEKVHFDFLVLVALVLYLIWYITQSYTDENRKMRKFSTSLKQLHRLNLNIDASLDDALNDYLKTGAELFSLKTGMIIEISKDSHFIRNISSVPQGSTKEKKSFALNYSLLEQVRKQRSTIYYTHKNRNSINDEVQGSIPYTFIGTPLMFDNEIYGLLNFFSDDTEKAEFESYEIEIIELMALNISQLLSLKFWKDSRKETERALVMSEERFKGIFFSAYVGISVSSLEGKIIMTNKALQDLLGYSENELVGKLISDLSHPEDLAEDTRLFEQLKEGEISNYSLEKRNIQKNGDEILVDLTVSLIQDEEGKPQFTIGLIQDISQRKTDEVQIKTLNEKLESQIEMLESTNKELESFSYSVSHDLRAPLRAIDGFSKIIMEDHADKFDEEATRLLNVIITNSNKMGNLIDDLLTFSRVTRKATDFKPVDMESIVTEIIQEQAIDPSIIHLEELPSIKGEATQLKQIYSNLISNAVKFSHKQAEPKVEIGCNEKDGECTFYVKDNGVGFDMKYYSKLFGVFQRLHSNDEFKGTGVGLSIVEKVVSKHKGKVWAESEEGHGASFFFTIPKNLSRDH